MKTTLKTTKIAKANRVADVSIIHSLLRDVCGHRGKHVVSSNGFVSATVPAATKAGVRRMARKIAKRFGLKNLVCEKSIWGGREFMVSDSEVGRYVTLTYLTNAPEMRVEFKDADAARGWHEEYI